MKLKEKYINLSLPKVCDNLKITKSRDSIFRDERTLCFCDVSLATSYEMCMESEQLQRAERQKQTGNEQASSETVLHSVRSDTTNLTTATQEAKHPQTLWHRIQTTLHLAHIVHSHCTVSEMPGGMSGGAGLKLF